MDYTSKTAADRAARNATRVTGVEHVAIRVGASASRMGGSYFRVFTPAELAEFLRARADVEARVEAERAAAEAAYVASLDEISRESYLYAIRGAR